MLRPLGRTIVSSIARNVGFGTVKQLFDLGVIRHVGDRSYQAVNPTLRGADTNVGLHPQVPLISFFVWCISGSRESLTEGSAAIKVASTMVPLLSSRPRLAKCWLIDSNNARVC